MVFSAAATTPSNPEAAPGDLELIRSFVNSRELDPDREDLATAEGLREFLEAHRIDHQGDVGDSDAARARDFRETLRAMLLEKEAGGVSAATAGRLRAAAEGASLRMDVADDGSVSVTPTCGGADALIAEVLAVVAAAQETGEWERMKVCMSDECLWAFYDRSRNRSRHWCSMDVCGNRAKTRAYRAKRT